jgi:hypothetical protein
MVVTVVVQTKQVTGLAVVAVVAPGIMVAVVAQPQSVVTVVVVVVVVVPATQQVLLQLILQEAVRCPVMTQIVKEVVQVREAQGVLVHHQEQESMVQMDG